MENDSDEIRKRSNFYLQKVDAQNEMEELGIYSEEAFLDKVIILQSLGNIPAKRVFGEYHKVSRITKYPVLMNMAMSISLTKEQVVELVKSLSKLYIKQLESLRTFNMSAKLRKAGGIIPVRFSLTMRGHADPNKFEISLPKVGDWRMGRDGMYSAETVFHEFAHVIDFGRSTSVKVNKSSATLREVHREDFVYILDNMLLKYKDWIEERYDRVYHKNQILYLNNKLSEFENNKKSIISTLAKEEKIERDKLTKEQLKKYNEAGISENSYPLYLILKEDNDVKTKLIEWSLNQLIDKEYIVEKKNEARELSDKILSSTKPILDKDEILLLNKAISQGSRVKFSSTLPISEQFNAMPIIKKFENEVFELSKGELQSHKITKSRLLVDEYDEELIIGDEEDMNKILS